jgi:uncharacterized protein YbjT (DUF2867 family)
MVLVAVAGGTSPTLGKSIVNAIITEGNHEVVILSRASSEFGSNNGGEFKYGAPVRAVDYNSVESLTHGLAGVHTLISIIKSNDPEQMVLHHQNMLEAAEAAGVKRFAPSEWGMGPLANQKVDLIRPKLKIWDLCLASRLECTRFFVGMFMNYLGQGCPATRRREALSGLEDDLMLDFVNVEAGNALIPVTSDGRPGRLSLCELSDVGKFVAAALNLETWEKEMGMVGSTTTMEEIVWVAERTGRLMRTKTFTKAHAQQRIAEFDQQLQRRFSLEALKGRMVAQMVECMCEDEVGCAVVEPVLNRLCPHIGPMAFDEYLTRVWSDSRI